MRYSWLLSGVFALGGCGDGLNVVPVSGVITLDGTPLNRASINTQPIGQGTRTPGPGSFGRTDAQGHFELELVKPARKGAIVGQHRVMILREDASSASSRQVHKSADGTYEYGVDEPLARPKATGAAWPARFMDGSLTIEVPEGGTDQIQLDLDAHK